MILAPNERVEKFRYSDTLHYSDVSYGNNGMFVVPYFPLDHQLRIIASDGMGWEHVSVTVIGRRKCPTWEEMDFIKRLFWVDEEAVMQLHPPRSTWISNHPYCLHLWKPIGSEILLPSIEMVGILGFEGKI